MYETYEISSKRPVNEKIIMGSVAFFILFPSWMIFNALYDRIKADSAWKDLRGKSEVHDVLVGAYRSCRDKWHNAGTTEECLLVVKDYAELKGYEAYIPSVLEDITRLSTKIINGEL